VLAEGTCIGDFRIRRLLGEGAMGQVYLAHDTTLGRRVALKLIKRSAMQSNGIERFLEEARTTASFNHPHIVTLYAVGEHEGRPYLALEYIDGESLRAHLTAGPLPIGAALRCCRAVAEAVAEAHRCGLVHADLKPENIVIPSDGRVRVVDFGLAKLVRGAVDAASGTPAYMAPERWHGAPPTGAIDIWALGVTLHELITGTRPIANATLSHLAFEVDTLELTGLPAEPWAEVVRNCLARDPAARPTSEELVRQLTELLEAPADGLEVRAIVREVPHTPHTPHLRLAFSARNAGAPADAWLEPVVEQMVRQSFRDRQHRRFHVVERRTNAKWIELTVVHRSEQIRLEAVSPADARSLASASASSVAGAVRALTNMLETEFGADCEPVGPDAEELEAMRSIGATSAALLRRYRRVLHAHFATSLPDLTALAAEAREIIADDPEWAHAYALLVTIEGQATEAARTVLATARRAARAARDPSGMQLIGALELSARGDPEAAFQLEHEAFRQNGKDLLAGALLASWAMLARRSEEAAAITQQLHVAFPELSFGADLALWLRCEGRDGDADRVIHEWVAATPDNLPARVELVRIAANAGRLDQAQARACEMVMLHGDRDDALPELFETFVASGQLSRGREIVDRMLAGSPAIRAYGRYRAAVASVLEGRFTAAYDIAQHAIAEHRAFGMRSELTQCLELARSLAPLVADTHTHRRYTEELADVFAGMIGDAGTAAANRFEVALLECGGATPSIEDHLAGLEDGPMRDVARRRMLRAAALADCGSPHAAVAAGFSTIEENTASLVAFGICAQRVHELALARRSLALATRRWSSINNNQSSPYHAVLAQFHLAGVLAELGEHAAARASFEAFLRCWPAPDRHVPEITIARMMLEAVPRDGS